MISQPRLSHGRNDTVAASYSREGGQLHVAFDMPASGFTLDQLDALEAAIAYARRRMLEDQEHSRPTLCTTTPPKDDMSARFQEQLRRMQPVPT